MGSGRKKGREEVNTIFLILSKHLMASFSKAKSQKPLSLPTAFPSWPWAVLNTTHTLLGLYMLTFRRT